MNIEHFRTDLRLRMEMTGKGQSDLARDYGLVQSRLSLFLAGKSGISARYLLALFPFVYGAYPPAPEAGTSPTPSPATGKWQ